MPGRRRHRQAAKHSPRREGGDREYRRGAGAARQPGRAWSMEAAVEMPPVPSSTGPRSLLMSKAIATPSGHTDPPLGQEARNWSALPSPCCQHPFGCARLRELDGAESAEGIKAWRRRLAHDAPCRQHLEASTPILTVTRLGLPVELAPFARLHQHHREHVGLTTGRSRNWASQTRLDTPRDQTPSLSARMALLMKN